jgi:hypothetical protein
MINSIDRLFRDRRGNALAIAGAALPLIVGAAGLATDTIQWVTWKRQLQRAADSAAFAGVYAKAQNASVTANAAVNTDLANNNFTPANLVSGYPQIAYPTSGSYQYAVQVTLGVQRRLGFSSLFLSNAPIITTSATAAMVDADEYCAWALKRGAGPSIRIGGSSQSTLGCPVVSNSSDPTNSVQTMGTSYNFVAPKVSGAGGMPSSITGVQEIDSWHMPQPDPFANQFSTDIPSGSNCTNFNQHVTSVGTGQNRTYTVSPGCFSNFQISGNETYVFSPGVYYLDSTDFAVTGGATITGTDVTIILTGNNPGSVSTNGNATIQLSAPTTGPYAKMLMIQSPNATESNDNTINGSAASSYDGTLYFPKGEVKLNGSAGTTTKCVMVVGWELEFNGNSNLQNNTSGCRAAQKKATKEIRLVA